MGERKQIRVFIDEDQWADFKNEVTYREDNSAVLKRLLAELLQLRALVGKMNAADVAQIHLVLPELAKIHDNPLIAVGMCLGSVRQGTVPPKMPLPPPPVLAAKAVEDDFIDNSDKY